MKNKQKTPFKFIFLYVLISLTSISALYGQDAEALIKQADSLFEQKQYTQSFTLYKNLFDQKRYTESMLVKMAFIQEGLGHAGKFLYYLNLYYLASGDERALHKMEETAQQSRLQGYEINIFTPIRRILNTHYAALAEIMGGLAILLFGLLFYQKRKNKKKPYQTGIMLVFILGILFLHTDFSKRINQGIIDKNSTYIMTGPSSGASVMSIVKEGHRVEVTGKDDVWVRIRWMGQEAYVKEDQIVTIVL